MDRLTEIIPVFVEEMTKPYEHGKIYISEKHEVAIHLCACGCGAETVMPFSDTFPDNWKLIKEADGTITFEGQGGSAGSVSNYQEPCRSHYHIIKNRIIFV